MDLSPETHAQLDAVFASCYPFNVYNIPNAALLLMIVLNNSVESYEVIWPIDSARVNLAACQELLESKPDILELLHIAHRTGRYAEIRKRPEFHMMPIVRKEVGKSNLEHERRTSLDAVLYEAYHKPFFGNAAVDFVNYLVKTDEDVRVGRKPVYAKALSVIQSSGTGKSRLLTEAGKQIFTLPICLRDPTSPGYPRSDPAVYTYFSKVNKNNEFSVSAHVAIACFLGAAFSTMLEWLVRAGTTRQGMELLAYWNSVMEKSQERNKFFQEVVKQADLQPRPPPMRLEITYEWAKNGYSTELHRSLDDCAEQCYKLYVNTAMDALAKFALSLTPQKPVFVIYFDEANELEQSYWTLLRILNNQDRRTSVWSVFMSTELRMTTVRPVPMRSLRLSQELECLLEPYIALGFDQNAIREGQRLKVVTMGHLSSIKHLSIYGRPMWNAQFKEGDTSLFTLAALKLVGLRLDPENMNHVLAILSQRICVETVLVSSEALQLADRGVANHMRLLMGITDNRKAFQTHSPSEPALALGAAQLLYQDKSVLPLVLDTFSHKLCEAGLIEKGLGGELAARILLLIARDLAAPIGERSRAFDLLIPVLVMDFLDKLFGNTTWCGSNRKEFKEAFKNAYVNFTHWIVTKGPLPEPPSEQLLANLWARGAGLQCCFRQESLDLLIVTYNGSIAPHAVFDVNNLSGMAIQIRYKVKAGTQTQHALRPIGIPRDIYQPLPYIALLMELGNESHHHGTKGKIKVTIPPEAADGMFESLGANRDLAVKRLNEYKAQNKWTQNDAAKKRLKEDVENAQAKMDGYNRFSISVRGASPAVYGVLQEANIVDKFKELLLVTMPSPTAQDTTLKYMRPLEDLNETSDYTAWMSVYGVENEEEESRMEDGLLCLDNVQ